MRKFLLALALLLLLGNGILSSAFAAPILAWDAVTMGSDGLPLGSGLGVTEYRVYACGTSAAACTAPARTRIGTVLAPATQFDLAGQPVPHAYVVTAVNKAGESLDSVTLKVVPPDVPKNPRLP